MWVCHFPVGILRQVWYLVVWIPYLCTLTYPVSVMLWGLFIMALWSPAGKEMTSWLSFVMFNCVFVTFPCGILGQVWCLIVLIPDLCPFYYFVLWSEAWNTITQLRKIHGYKLWPDLYSSMQNHILYSCYMPLIITIKCKRWYTFLKKSYLSQHVIMSVNPKYLLLNSNNALLKYSKTQTITPI